MNLKEASVVRFRGAMPEFVDRTCSVGTATGYELNGQGSIMRKISFFFTASSWGPPNLLSNGYWRLIPPGDSGPGREADHLHLVPSSGIVELYLRSPIRLHGVVFNYLSTGTTVIYLTPGFI
jgi:hypothetical protein